MEPFVSRFTEEEIGKISVNASYNIHRKFGPGLLERPYQEFLVYDLTQAGLFVEKEVALPLIYETVKLDAG